MGQRAPGGLVRENGLRRLSSRVGWPVCYRFFIGRQDMQENESPGNGMRAEYQHRMLAIRGAFEAGATGAATIAARAAAINRMR